MRRADRTGIIRTASLAVLATALATSAQAQSKAKTQDSAPPATGDIVSDADFEATLPKFDLTPLEATAAPEPEPQPLSEADSSVIPTGSPAEAPGELPPVTLDDAELAAPLPALEGYDVRPLQAATQPDRDAPDIRYDVRMTGLGGNLKDRFRDLSALEGGDGRAANTAMIRARANEDEALILRLMKSEGYFDGTVGTSLRPTPDKVGQTHVEVTAVPGAQYRLRNISLDAQTTVPPDLLQYALPLKADDPIIADRILAAEANVSVDMQQNGYPFTRIGARDILLDPLSQTGDYRLKVDTGPRASFGGFRSDGDIVFAPEHIAVLTRFNRGELYDNRKVDDLREALVATSLFSSVAVEPVLAEGTAPDGTAYVDLVVHQQKGPSRTLAAEVGYSTGEGFSASASWQDRNRFPPEGALIFTGVVGTQEQSLSSTFRRSNDKRRDRTTQLSASAAHNVYDAYDANTASLSFSRSRVSTPLWQKVWTWSWGLDVLATQEISTDLTNNTRNVREVFYLADAPIRIGYDRSDDLLNPTRGFRVGVQTIPEVNLGQTGAPNLKTVVDASYYHPLNDRMVIATRARLGSQVGAELSQIAPSRRLYAGGGGSVRGFAYQGLGPLDASGDPTGALSLFEASLEVRYRLGDLGIVPFIDIGQAYADEVPDFSDLRAGIGVGARLYTNFGPIRIDVAMPIGKRDNDPQVALYVGIGQAF